MARNKKIILGGEKFSNDYIKKINKLSFSESKLISKKLFDAYRLTKEYKKAYCKYLIENYPEGKAVEQAINTIKKFKRTDNVSLKTHKKLIADIVYTTNNLGFITSEYFWYDFEKKSNKERMTYTSNVDIINYFKKINTNCEENHILGNKYLTYERFKDYFKRDIIKIESKDDKDKFLEFVKKHNKFIIKPINEALGKMIEIIDVNNYKNYDEVFDYLTSLNKRLIVEELIVQGKSFADIHKESVNTVRIFTYNNGKKVKVVCAWLKCGQGSSIVDNGGAGGMLSAINKKTGIVGTNARDELAIEYKVQPDTGFKFKGFQIPNWKEARKMAKAAAKLIPGVPLVGWDFAYSDELGWQMIEGNEGGQIFLIQIPLKKGRKKQYEKIIEWDKWKKQS